MSLIQADGGFDGFIGGAAQPFAPGAVALRRGDFWTCRPLLDRMFFSLLLTATVIAAFTIFMHFDGYWIVESALADAVLADPQQFVHLVDKAPTKLAACRRALALGLAAGASELHLEGAGVRPTIATEVRRAGLVPVIVPARRRTDLTA